MRRFASLALLVACSEQFPRELTPPVPPSIPTDAGVDAPPDASVPERDLVDFTAATTVSFKSPVEVAVHDGRVYVLELGGLLRVLSADRASASTVADFTTKVTTAGEAGLLGIAFHPSFATNGYVYLYFTAPKTGPGIVFESVVARYTSTDGGLTLDLATEKRILAVDQPASNHNGGTIQFGLDGFLYFALGDGGGAPLDRPQDPNNLLGKIVRIDVDGGDPYAIPPTNPYAIAGGRPEIYASGFRNPFRFRFDTMTGTLWAGDVGGGVHEEIDKVVLGGNYGWPLMEGNFCHAPPCDPSFLPPVVDHPRNEASTITGGVVYRGDRIPSIRGKYVYGDFTSNYFWALAIDGGTPQLIAKRYPEVFSATSFALDTDGEILFTSLVKGRLFKIVPTAP